MNVKTCLYPNGSIQRTKFTQRGFKQIMEYFDSGRLKMHIIKNTQTRECKYMEFYETGVVHICSNLLDQTNHGVTTLHAPSGALIEYSVYEFGTLIFQELHNPE